MTAIATAHWAGHHRHHERPAGGHHAGKLLLGAALMRAMAEGRRRHGGHRGYGPGHGWIGPGPFGQGGFGPFRPGGRGKRARRGDVRAAILLLLEEEPRNGYQIMQELSERTGGAWRPSPGSIYPALNQLEDEGLVAAAEVDGRKAYSLTDAGRQEVEARTEEQAPWDAVSASATDGVHELRDLIWQLGAAAMQVAHAGNAAQLEEAKKIVADARKAIYRILAADDEQ